MIVLTVQIDEPGAELRELADGREAAVHVGPRAPVSRDHARQDGFVACVAAKASLDPGFRRALADERRIRAPTEEEVERLDEQRLARARLPRDGGEAVAEEHGGVVDDAEVADVELLQHR